MCKNKINAMIKRSTRIGDAKAGSAPISQYFVLFQFHKLEQLSGFFHSFLPIGLWEL